MEEAAPAAKPRDEMEDLTNMGESQGFTMPASGRPAAACWSMNSSHAAVHMAGGGVTKAMQLLNRQIAMSDFSKVKTPMLGTYVGSFVSMPGIPGSGSMRIPLMKNDAEGHPGDESLPRTSLKLKTLINGVKSGYRSFQGGKFNDAKAGFSTVLTTIPLVVTENAGEANEIKEMVEICREYILAIRIKGAMAENTANPARSTELSAYFTHCNLQPPHFLLALRSAMGTAFKHKNFICAASFARRLLELPDMSNAKNADLRVKATKILQKSEQMARNEHTLNYNESTSFNIDSKNFVPIYPGDKAVQCPFTGSWYDESMKGKLCKNSGICVVGVKTIGLVT
jgi:coatomer protein complex subunit alpha (xenin)